MITTDPAVDEKEDVGTVMTNADNSVDEDVVRQLKGHPERVGGYPGWDFYAHVWHEDGKWRARVKSFRVVVGWYEADSPRALMRAVSNDWGWK